jgi:T-complex protein 1 subunit gamma
MRISVEKIKQSIVSVCSRACFWLAHQFVMQTPVYVMNQTMQREQGHKAQLSNIQAAKAVADIIRTTLGPRSMLKMLLDPLGGIVMTNDGNAILREINVRG